MTIETGFPSQRVTNQRDMSSMTTLGYQTSSYQPGMKTISRHIGSNSWPRGKWQGSLGSMYQGKPHLSRKYMPPQHKGKKIPWGQSTLYRAGSGRCSLGPQSIMVHYSSMSRSPEIGERSGRSSDSVNSSTTYVTSTSESPISRWNAKECHKPSQH
jgi:hypothetical protein